MHGSGYSTGLFDWKLCLARSLKSVKCSSEAKYAGIRTVTKVSPWITSEASHSVLSHKGFVKAKRFKTTILSSLGPLTAASLDYPRGDCCVKQ